jgi:hypothetical protein
MKIKTAPSICTASILLACRQDGGVTLSDLL